MNDDIMTDTDLDRLLASATAPRLSSTFNGRLLQRLNSETVAEASNVIPFPVRPVARKATSWPMVLPLLASMAAALAGGLYLGSATNLQSLVTSSSAVASADETDLTGFEYLDTAMQDNQS